MKVEIWSDVACPWCFVGKRRFEAALAAFDGDVDVVWRSFELDPRPGRAWDGPIDEMLARKYHCGIEHARRMIDNMVREGRGESIEFDFDNAVPANTFRAHQLIHLAQKHGRGPQMKERLLAAHLCEGRAISTTETLIELAAEVGLDAEEARRELDDGTFAEAVRQDEQQAVRNGVTGVPFFLFEGQFAVSGAQQTETMLQVLGLVREKLRPAPAPAAGCEDDACAVPASADRT